MKFISKANVLQEIKNNSNINIPNFFFFSISQFKKNKKKILIIIKNKFKNKLIIVRSSAYGEDSKKNSKAGKFVSIPNLNPNNLKLLEEKINEVINSYDKKNINNKVLVQTMIVNAKIHGVAFTSDRNDLSPYITINYSLGKNTSLITSGMQNGRILNFYRSSKIYPKNKVLKKIIIEIKKIIKVTNEENLDVEFLVDSKNKFYLLQARPIVIKKIKKNNFNFNFFLDGFSKKISKLNINFGSLYGKKTSFSNMSDWNPAEMIGTKPKNLAMTLYKELITNQIWAANRSRYGFTKVENMPLMVNFFGSPYIDMRVDFNSWLPSDLNHKIKKKLVDYYLRKLEKNPSNYDKIEFKIVFTCFSFNTKKNLNKIKLFGSSEKNRILKSLKKINLIAFKEIKKDELKIKYLIKKNNEIMSTKLHTLNKIYWLIENCKIYGTQSFAGFARCAFIGTELLNSLVDNKILSEEEKLIFLGSFNTVTKNILVDFNNFKKKEFISKYGHLRPGTYDITSKNYKEGYKIYFEKRDSNEKKLKIKKFKLKKNQIFKINSHLNKEKIKLNHLQLFDFIKKSIQLREYGKFIFTKTVDDIFICIKKLGKRCGINLDQLQHIDIALIKNLYLNIDAISVREELLKNIYHNKKIYKLNKNLKLPDFIKSYLDPYYFEDFINKPTFISQKIITGNVLLLEKNSKQKNLNDKVLCIENADPGYDYLFTKKIKALITKYGGVNSHMAIRCNELNLPAAIGVGDKMFDYISKNKIIYLDCLNKKIKIIK